MIFTAHNFALLQWRVVDVASQCSLITIARRTRPPLQAMLVVGGNALLNINATTKINAFYFLASNIFLRF